jgi:hypothetical protein
MTDPLSADVWTRCGLAEATCYAMLSPEFARALRISPTQFAAQPICDRCWRDLFGDVEDSDAWVRRRVGVGERQMEQVRAMIEREGWG